MASTRSSAKSATDQLQELIAIVKQQSADLSNLMLKHDQVLTKYAALSEELADAKAEIKRLSAVGALPSCAIPSGFEFAKLVAEADLFRRKSVVAVVEKLPESDDGRGMVVNDREMIERIAAAVGVAGSLLGDEIHRHGGVKASGKARILKVPFVNKDKRDLFLYGFRKALRLDKSLPQNPTVRRDMVPSELDVLYALRRDAYAKNKDAGMIKYVIVDLKMVEIKNPKPFLVANK